jgi:ribosomal protein S27E
MARNDTAVVVNTIGYAGKGSKVKRVTDSKKLGVMMKKMQLDQGKPTFTWRMVGVMKCPKCGHKEKIAYDPSKPVRCVDCLIKALEKVPELEPAMVGRGKNKIGTMHASIIIEVPVEAKAKKKG